MPRYPCNDATYATRGRGLLCFSATACFRSVRFPCTEKSAKSYGSETWNIWITFLRFFWNATSKILKSRVFWIFKKNAKNVFSNYVFTMTTVAIYNNNYNKIVKKKKQKITRESTQYTSDFFCIFCFWAMHPYETVTAEYIWSMVLCDPPTNVSKHILSNLLLTAI